MSVPTYGTAIRKRKSKRILDVDLSHDREVAERLVAQQNAKDAIRASRVEWVVVEIRALEPADSADQCPEWNCPDLSTEDRREAKTCPDHPCTCPDDKEQR